MPKRTRRIRNVSAVAAAVVLSAGLAACGGGNDDGDAAGGGTASGSPLKVYSVAPYTSGTTSAFDEARATAQAAVADINADGGVGGRPLELETCDSKLTPPGEQTCFQKAAADKDVVGVVGGYHLFPDASAKIASTAGMAVIGGLGNGRVALNNPNFFVQVAGYPNAYYVAAQHAIEGGAKKVVYFAVDLPGGVELEESVKEAAKAGGAQVGAVRISASETSTAAAASKVVSTKPDAVILALSDLQTQSSIQQMRRGGFDGPVYVQTTLTSADSMKALAKFDNLVGFDGAPPFTAIDAPGIKAYRDAMAKHEPKAVLNGIGVSTWLAFQTLKQVGEATDGEITRESLKSALEQTSQLDTQGITAEVDGWYTGKAPFAGYPRLFNNQAVITSLDGDQLGWDGKWHPGLGSSDAAQPAS